MAIPGTELTDYLGLASGTFPTALDAAFNYVAQKDAPNGLCWTSETKFTDTNGIAIKAADRGTFGDTLSAFGSYLASHRHTGRAAGSSVHSDGHGAGREADRILGRHGR